jgi:hypothetical protein
LGLQTEKQAVGRLDFGNFNYGATGYVSGIPPAILLKGAGFAQSRAGTSNVEEWGHW